MPLKPVQKLAGLNGEAERAVREQLNALIARVEELSASPRVTGLKRANYIAREGEYVRTIGGLNHTLPPARLENQGKEVTFFIESAATTPTRFTASGSTINGASAVQVSGARRVTFQSNGDGGWLADEGESVAAAVAAAASRTVTSAPPDAHYHLRLVDARLPNARVADDSTEIDLDYTSAGLVSWFLKTASVAFSKLANLTGLSVLGRAANSTGVMAAITASTPRHVLRLNQAATSLEWGMPVSLRDDAIPVGSGHHTLSFDSGTGTVSSVIDGGSGIASIAFNWDGTTNLVPDGDKGHIVVSGSGAIWLWDNPISIAGSQEIAPTGNLTLTVGADLLANATSGVFIGAGVSAASVGTGNVNISGTADSLWNMQSGMNITLGSTASSAPATAVGTGVFALNCDTGFSLRAGHAAANNTGAGDGYLNATSGIAIHAGATPVTSASGLALSSDTTIIGNATTAIRWQIGGTEYMGLESDGSFDFDNGFNFDVTGAGTFDIAGSFTFATSGAGTDMSFTAVDDAIFAGNDTFITGAAQTVIRATAGNTILAASSDVRIETNSVTRWSWEEDGSVELAGDAGDLGSGMLSQGATSPPIWSDRADVFTRTTIIAGGSSAETDIISLTVPANTWVVGTTYEFFAHCEYVRTGTAATSHTVTIDAELNGSGIGLTLAAASTTTNTATYEAIVHGYLTCTSTGAGGAGNAAFSIGQNIVAGSTQPLSVSAGTSLPSLDTTASNTLSITVDFSAGIAGASFRVQRAWIRRVV